MKIDESWYVSLGDATWARLPGLPVSCLEIRCSTTVGLVIKEQCCLLLRCFGLRAFWCQKCLFFQQKWWFPLCCKGSQDRAEQSIPQPFLFGSFHTEGSRESQHRPALHPTHYLHWSVYFLLLFTQLCCQSLICTNHQLIREKIAVKISSCCGVCWPI